MNTVYAFITEETLTGAADRALKALDELTGGKAQEAIELVNEYVEFRNVLDEHKEKKSKVQ